MRKFNFFKLILLTPVFIFTMVSCDRFLAHPYYGAHQKDHNYNPRNVEKILKNCKEKDTVRFAVISDSHVKYDFLVDAVEDINKRNFDFVIHCGDGSDFGLLRELMRTHNIMNDLKMPYLMVLGNHDCLGTGKETYKEIYATSDLCFDLKNARIITVNTNCVEYHEQNNIPDIMFIDGLIESPVEKPVFVAMHGAPWTDSFCSEKEVYYAKKLRSLGDNVICMYGHIHEHPMVDDYYGDGVNYYHVPKTAYKEYISFTITNEGVEYEAIEF